MSQQDNCGCNDCTCDDFNLGMFALLDRELTDQECARLNAHIENCATCSEAVANEEAIRALLKQCCCGKAPDTLREKIAYSIRVERTTYYSS
jgi:mycothiol system anti-sigma-R factor